MQRYQEAELISNRSPVLLYGGSAAERRAWAEEAASHFDHEGGLLWANTPEELLPALQRRGGVVAVEDVSVLDHGIQGQILNCLMRQEERPKVVLGLRSPASAALQSGALREDLHYRLSLAQVDLSQDEVRQAIRAREPERKAREAAKKKEAEQLAKVRAATVGPKPARRPLSVSKPLAVKAKPAQAPAKSAAQAKLPAKAKLPVKAKAATKAKPVTQSKPGPAKKMASKKSAAGKSARR